MSDIVRLTCAPWSLRLVSLKYIILKNSLSPRSLTPTPCDRIPDQQRVSGAPFCFRGFKKVFCFGSRRSFPRPIPQRSPLLRVRQGILQGRWWMTPPSIICSGSGPITIAPWTSQTPQDWVGEKGSSGVWGVSGPEPEPACRSVRQHNPSQACQPPLTLACRRSRGNWRRRPRPTQARHPLGSNAAVRVAVSSPPPFRRQFVWQARRRFMWQFVWQARRRFMWQACRSRLPPSQSLLLDSTLQCRPLEGAMQCPPLQGPFLQCPHFQSAPKCPIEPLLSPRKFWGVSSRIPWSAMAAQAPWSTTAARVPWIVMAARAPPLPVGCC